MSTHALFAAECGVFTHAVPCVLCEGLLCVLLLICVLDLSGLLLFAFPMMCARCLNQMIENIQERDGTEAALRLMCACMSVAVCASAGGVCRRSATD